MTSDNQASGDATDMVVTAPMITAPMITVDVNDTVIALVHLAEILDEPVKAIRKHAQAVHMGTVVDQDWRDLAAVLRNFVERDEALGMLAGLIWAAAGECDKHGQES